MQTERRVHRSARTNKKGRSFYLQRSLTLLLNYDVTPLLSAPLNQQSLSREREQVGRISRNKPALLPFSSVCQRAGLAEGEVAVSFASQPLIIIFFLLLVTFFLARLNSKVFCVCARPTERELADLLEAHCPKEISSSTQLVDKTHKPPLANQLEWGRN